MSVAPARIVLGCLLGRGGMGVSACSSAPGSSTAQVPVIVQQDASHQVRLSSISCGIEQLTGSLSAVIARGHAENTSAAAVFVSPQVPFDNKEGQELVNAGADSAALDPAHSWNWTATQPDVSTAQGVTDTRAATCVVSVLVSAASRG